MERDLKIQVFLSFGLQYISETIFFLLPFLTKKLIFLLFLKPTAFTHRNNLNRASNYIYIYIQENMHIC